MTVLDELVSQISDPILRTRIESEIKRMSKQRKFGLVFEEHLPECTPLYDIPIRKKSKVSKRVGEIKDIFTVENIVDEKADCINIRSNEKKQFLLSELVAIAQFGEPIYPFLREVDYVNNAPNDKMWHTLIEADNYHALQLLEYTCSGKVDCIYIDPPYNTGARDWKYNNDYVDLNDSYRHSKWLSMMEKRLKIAKKLLNPKDSVLIITIDEKEYLHLGCLLEQLFPEANIQMVSTVINPSGVSRGNEFYRTDEYIFFVKFGTSSPSPLVLSDDWLTAKSTGKDKLRWRPIRRQGSHDNRSDAYGEFYPIFISKDGKRFVGTGEPLLRDQTVADAIVPEDVIAIWPMKTNGSDGCWQISRETFEELHSKGYTKIGYSKKWGYTLKYLAKGEQKKVEKGQFPIIGRNEDGSIKTNDAEDEAPFIPGTQWRIPEHSARENGSSLLNKIFVTKRFSFPKSLYATRDAIKFFVDDKPDALIVDFFAGSCTTMHAVNLINAEDGGHRRCICITNNEVSEEEEKKFLSEGLQPGEPNWEKYGIAKYISWPRIKSSILGVDVNGNPLKGTYIESDIEMSDGFESNAIYFKLSFLDKDNIALGRQFAELIPVLWMKSGAVGKMPQITENDVCDIMLFKENEFAVLNNESNFLEFVNIVNCEPSIKTVYIVTDSETSYKNMISEFTNIRSYQLYRDYLDNFRINRRV